MAESVDDFGKKLSAAKIDKAKLLSKIALTVQGNSERVTPVKTGTLKRSETTRVEASADRAFIGSNVNYARFVHDGTSRMTARPFFEEGMEASRDTIDQLLEDAGMEFLSKLT